MCHKITAVQSNVAYDGNPDFGNGNAFLSNPGARQAYTRSSLLAVILLKSQSNDFRLGGEKEAISIRSR